MPETPIDTVALYNDYVIGETPIGTVALYNDYQLAETPITTVALYNDYQYLVETPIDTVTLYNRMLIIYGQEFEMLMDTFRKGFRGKPSFEVTRSILSLGTRDSVTGWCAKNYGESTIKMILIQKESQNLALKMGYWVSLDALGLTIDIVNVYDLITDALGRTWEIKVVKPIIVGDTVKYFACDLKELPLYE